MTQEIFESLKRYISLNIEYARLTTAQKLTILLSSIALYAVAVLVFLIMLAFASIGVGQLLERTAIGSWAYVIISGFYLLLLVLLFVFRKTLFVNPVARFISRLIVESPKK